jgi:hypothetical protein
LERRPSRCVRIANEGLEWAVMPFIWQALCQSLKTLSNQRLGIDFQGFPGADATIDPSNPGNLSLQPDKHWTPNPGIQ